MRDHLATDSSELFWGSQIVSFLLIPLWQLMPLGGLYKPTVQTLGFFLPFLNGLFIFDWG